MQYARFCIQVILVVLLALVTPASVYADTVTNESLTGVESPPEQKTESPVDFVSDGQQVEAPAAESSLSTEVEEVQSLFVSPAAESSEVAGSTSEEPAARRLPVITEVQTQGECPVGVCTGNAVEFVELYNPHPVEINLAGLKLRYHGTTATQYDAADLNTVIMAPYQFVIVGKFMTSDKARVLPLQRELANSGGAVFLADASSPTVAIDKVAWGSAVAGYYDIKAAEAPSLNHSIQRCFNGVAVFQTDPRDTSREFTHYKNDIVTPGFGMACSAPEVPPVDSPPVNMCAGVILNEIGANLDDQFVELYNTNAQAVDLDGCQLRTNRSATRMLVFGAEQLDSFGYKVIHIKDSELTLTKTTTGAAYLLSSDGKVEVDAQTYTNLASGTSWSRFEDGWRQSYAPSPGGLNIDQVFLPCDDGYVRNESTGRCNKLIVESAQTDCGDGKYRSEETGRCRAVPVVSVLAACKLGQYRSEETNRCRNLVGATTLTPCKEGQYRSEETNRCRNILTASANLKPCKENQYRSEETNRCRNVPASTIPAAAYAVESVKDDAKTFVGWWALSAVVLLAAGYAGWEWRSEVSAWVRNISFSRRGGN